MGLMDDFGVDIDKDIKAASFDIDDGTYDFEVAEASIRNGSKKNPDNTFFVIKYDLDEAGSYQEWFTVAQNDGELTARAKQSLGFLKARLKDLGFSENLNELDAEDLEGVRGTFTLKTSKTAKGEFQNIRNLKIEVDDPTDYDDDAPVVKKKDVPAKKVKGTKKSGDDGDENPFA